MKIFDDLLSDDPNNVFALVARGTCLALLTRLDEAITDFTNAINIFPKLPDAYRRRAQCYAAKGKVSEAIKDLNEYI